MRIASNKLKDIIKFAHQELDTLYNRDEARTMIYPVIEHFTGISLVKILSCSDELKVSESELLKINFAIKDLKKEKPLQQILGYCDFLDVKINLNKNVLIPRVETEEIVLNIIRENKNKTISKIADLGCGSGCISLALKKNFPKAEVYSFDISDEALEQTKENAELNNLELKIIKADILKEIEINEEFDLIVSNPPYVRESEKKLMRNNVLLYEPSLALFVSDENPLIFYKQILNFSKKNLSRNGVLYMEINEFLSQETEHLFQESNFKTTVIKDLRGKDRLIIAKNI